MISQSFNSPALKVSVLSFPLQQLHALSNQIQVFYISRFRKKKNMQFTLFLNVSRYFISNMSLLCVRFRIISLEFAKMLGIVGNNSICLHTKNQKVKNHPKKIHYQSWFSNDQIILTMLQARPSKLHLFWKTNQPLFCRYLFTTRQIANIFPTLFRGPNTKNHTLRKGI